MAKKRWADLSGSERTGLLVLSGVQFGLLATALWDLAHRSADEVRGDRRIWAGVVFINWIGPLAYFLIGRRQGGWIMPKLRGGDKQDTGAAKAQLAVD
jgi:hypothetical protein